MAWQKRVRVTGCVRSLSVNREILTKVGRETHSSSFLVHSKRLAAVLAAQVNFIRDHKSHQSDYHR